MRLGTAAVLLAAGTLAGCLGGPGGHGAGHDLEQGTWTHSTLDPDWSLVLEYSLPAGASLEWDWFTGESRDLYFQLAKVEGQRSTQLVGRHASEDEGQAAAASDGAYQLIWINDSSFTQSFTWQATEGFSQSIYPPNQGPGCLSLAVPACLPPVVPPG